MPISDQQRAEFRQIFDAVDTDGSGELSAPEVLKIVQSQGCNCTLVHISNFLAQHDKDANGNLSFDEFIALLNSLGF